MSTATANAEAGPSNQPATASYRRLRFPSPADDYQNTKRRTLSSTVELPRALPTTRYPWPPKGRLISRHVDGDKIVAEYEQLTDNFLREYANGVRDERRRIMQRKLDLQERLKAALLGAKRGTILSAASMKKVTRFMEQLTELFQAEKPPQPAQQQPEEDRDEDQGDGGKDRSSPRGENKENERGAEESDDESDDDESGDEGPAAGGAAIAREAHMGEASGSQREALVDLASDSDIDSEQDMDIDEPWPASPEDAEREAHQNGKQREVDPEDDQEDLSPQFAADRPQSSPKKRKRAAEDGDESEEEREVERSIDISYHPSDLVSNAASSPRSPKRQRFESGSHRAPFPLLDSPQGSEGGGSGAEEDGEPARRGLPADWTYGSIVFSPPTLPSAVQRALAGPTPPRGPPNPGPFRPPFDFPSPPRQTSQQLLSDDVAGPSQSSSAHPDQPWAPLSNVASSSSNWNGPLPSTPPQQTGQASRRLPRYLGDPLVRRPPPPSVTELAIAAMNDPRRNVIRREGPGQVVVGYDEERGEFRWAPGGRTTTEAQQALAANRARVLQPLRSSGVTTTLGGAGSSQQRGGASSQATSSRLSQTNVGTSQAPAQRPPPVAGPSRHEQNLPNLLRRHDTYLEGPNPWVIINSSNLGTVWPAPPPPVVPAAPVVQAPLLDHYPSPASSHEELREEDDERGRVYGEAEDDEGLEYTDGEDNGDPEGEGSYEDEEAEEAW